MSQHQYALPTIAVVDEVRPCVIVPILPKCDASRVLVNSLVPITALGGAIIARGAEMAISGRGPCSEKTHCGKVADMNNPSSSPPPPPPHCCGGGAPNPLDIALSGAIERHQRVVLSNAALAQGLGPRGGGGGGAAGRKRERGTTGEAGDGAEEEPSAAHRRFFSADSRLRGEQFPRGGGGADGTHRGPFYAEDCGVATPSAAPQSPLAIVEWSTGDVSCTHDTAGLGEEERLRLRYTLNLRRDPLQRRYVGADDAAAVRRSGASFVSGGGDGSKGEEEKGGDCLCRSAAPFAHPPLQRENAPRDIAREQLLRMAHSDLISRHSHSKGAGAMLRSLGMGAGTADSATRAMHCTLPPAFFSALFPSVHSTAATAQSSAPSVSSPLSSPSASQQQGRPSLPRLDALASALVNNYDAVQCCRLVTQPIPSSAAGGHLGGGGGLGGGASLSGGGGRAFRGIDEDHDLRALWRRTPRGASSKRQDANSEESIQRLLWRVLRASRVGRAYTRLRRNAAASALSAASPLASASNDVKLEVEEEEHVAASAAANEQAVDAPPHEKGDAPAEEKVEDEKDSPPPPPATLRNLFSPSQLSIFDTFDVMFYRHDPNDEAMGLFAFTLGHALRPYGHSTVPFRLLEGRFAAQAADAVGLLLRHADARWDVAEACDTLEESADDAVASNEPEEKDEAAARRLAAETVVTNAASTIANAAAALLRAHINQLCATVHFALLGYAAEAAHRYVVVAVRNRLTKVRKAALSDEVTEALDYLFYRVHHSVPAEAAIDRLLLHPSAAEDGFLFSPEFWPAFAAEEERMLGRQCAHNTAAAVAQCQRDIAKMGRTHTWEEVNNAFYYKT